MACAALGAGLLTLPSLSRPERKWLAGAFALTLLVAGGAAFARGSWLVNDDAQRQARLEALRGESGPQLLMVSRSGCPFCAVLELDRLGDPSLEDLMSRAREYRRIPADDPLAQEHAGGPGTPVLLAIGAEGQLLGRLRGAKPLPEVREFLERVVSAPR